MDIALMTSSYDRRAHQNVLLIWNIAPAMQPVASVACFEDREKCDQLNIMLCIISMLAFHATSFEYGKKILDRGWWVRLDRPP
jgi:hypothetical protein